MLMRHYLKSIILRGILIGYQQLSKQHSLFHDSQMCGSTPYTQLNPLLIYLFSCQQAKILCGATCKCVGCKNFEESPERKTLMHLADAAEVRVNQQTAAKTKLSSQIQDYPVRPQEVNDSGERYMVFYVYICRYCCWKSF